MKKIPFPEKDFFENILKEAQKKEKIIKDLWSQVDKEKDTEKSEEIIQKIENLEKEIIENLTLFKMAKYLDKFFKRNENEIYDITKIFISEKNYELMKSYDKKITKIRFNYMTEESINKEVNMLYFMSGFSVKKDIDDNNIYLEEEYIIKRT